LNLIASTRRLCLCLILPDCQFA